MSILQNEVYKGLNSKANFSSKIDTVVLREGDNYN